MKYLTNSFSGGRVIFSMNIGWMGGIKRDRKVRARRPDLLAEQVREMLTKTDQKLILMVRQ